MKKRLPGLLFIFAALCFFIAAFLADAPGAFIASGSAFLVIGAGMLARAKASRTSRNP